MTPQEQRVIAEVERFIADKDDSLHLPREAAAFVHGLITGLRPLLSVEIGTSYGYSGLWIGSAIRQFGGRLITIDQSPRKTEVAGRYFVAAGVDGSIDARTGTALEVLEQLDGPFDFVLNDADKENCRRYVEMLLPKMSSGGMILTDNTTTHAEQLADFVAWVRSLDEVQSCEIPVGNGMELTIKQ